MCAIFIGGCKSTFVSRFDAAVPPNELSQIEKYLGAPDYIACFVSNDIKFQDCRNEYIAMKIFQIDQEFSKYKILLSRGEAISSLGSDLAQIGLGVAGGLIPATQTTKVILATATAVGLANGAINKDLLAQQTMQAIEHEMDILRDSVRKTITSRLSCSANAYPAGLVLADLQSYADAGNVTTALNAMIKATASAQATTNTSTGVASPTTTSTSPNSDAADAAGTGHSFTTKNGGTVTVTYKSSKQAGATCPIPSTQAQQPAKAKNPPKAT